MPGPLLIRLPRLEAARELAQMLRQVLVHFEHGALVGAKDFPELVVCKNFPLVIRVLQVVLANMIPNLRHDLATRQRVRPDDRCEIRRRLHREGKSAPSFTTSPFCHLALLLFWREIERDSPLHARGETKEL